MAKKLTNKTSYSYSKIKWTKSDTARLRSAINIFNKEVKKHIGEIPEKALPKLKTYSDVKSSIVSRKDLDLAISTMKKVKNKNAFDLVSSSANSNVKITNWELQTLKRYDYRNQVKLQTEYNKVLEGIRSVAKPVLDKYGNPILDEEGRPIARASFSTIYKNKLEGFLEETNVEMLLRSEDYYRRNELMERIYKRGSDLFELDKGKIYKENYLEVLKSYENLDHYEEVVDKLKSIDPKDFFKTIQKIDEEGADNFSHHYLNGMVQAEFNKYAKSLGIKIEEEPATETETQELIENLF